MDCGKCALSIMPASFAGVNCLKNGASLVDSDQAAGTVIVCTNEACGRAFRLHRACLEHWKSSAETQMQNLSDLAAILGPTLDNCGSQLDVSSDKGSPLSGDVSETSGVQRSPMSMAPVSDSLQAFSMTFYALKQLLECSECSVPCLCLAQVSSEGIFETKRFNSILDEASSLFQILNRSDSNMFGAPKATCGRFSGFTTTPQSTDQTLALQFSGLMQEKIDSGSSSLSPLLFPPQQLRDSNHASDILDLHQSVPTPVTTMEEINESSQHIALNSGQQVSRRIRCNGHAMVISQQGALPQKPCSDEIIKISPNMHRYSDTCQPNLGLISSHFFEPSFDQKDGFLLLGHSDRGVPKPQSSLKPKRKARGHRALRQTSATSVCSGSTSGAFSGLSSASTSSPMDHSYRSQGLRLSSLDSLAHEQGGDSTNGDVFSNLQTLDTCNDLESWMPRHGSSFRINAVHSPSYALPHENSSTGQTFFSSKPHMPTQRRGSEATDSCSKPRDLHTNCALRQRSGSLGQGQWIPEEKQVSFTTTAVTASSKSLSQSRSGPVTRSYSINVASLYTTKKPNSKGNIFRQRKDFSAFHILHPSKKNGYFIQLEDDSCTGNEDTRSFLLCQLTNHGASELYCLACRVAMPVYDHFPVVDGALFLSPIRHEPINAGSNKNGTGLQVVWTTPASATLGDYSSSPLAGQVIGGVAPPPGCTGPRQQQSQAVFLGTACGTSGSSNRSCIGGHRLQQHGVAGGSHPVCQERYLHAICMQCMRSTSSVTSSPLDPSLHPQEVRQSEPPQIVCKFCATPWKGWTLLIGGMYTYDLFASTPCCSEHLKCKSCGRMALVTGCNDATGVETAQKTRRAESYAGVATGSLTANEKTRRMSEGAQEEPSCLSPLLPLPFFSQYSNRLCCQHCHCIDYHFIKPFSEVYTLIPKSHPCTQ